MRAGVIAMFGALPLASACSDPTSDDDTAAATGSASESTSTDTASDSGDPTPAPRGCPPPEGVSARPESVEDVVTLLEALPLPTTLPCFLESLERPLSVAVSANDFSAQPADGPDNPRLFILSGPLTMSVVPTGIGRHLLEFAVDVGNRESIKAELEFPLTERVLPADPYDRIRFDGGGTSCSGCHAGERLSEAIDFTDAYVSEALQAPADAQFSIGFVQQHAAMCDPEADDERCQLLTAVFAHGEIQNTTLNPDYRICSGP
ncbi:MAG: hypothetical protein AAF721_16670 [Myxococcota bacterium]